MSQDSLSALLDGECSGPELDRLLDELERSPELGRQWSRLCMAKEAQAGTRIAAEQPCICADVMARLDVAPAAADAKVVDLAVHKAGKVARRPLAAYWKPAVGFAAAASMGAAAVMLIQPQSEQRYVSAGSVATLVAPDRNLRTVSAQDAAHADMLREYLMDHSNAVADEGVGGTLRYARFAAHTAEPQAYLGPHPDEQP
jgi:negative regulator of sigma E activity